MSNSKLKEWFLGATAVMMFVVAALILGTAFHENRVLELPDALLSLRGQVVFYLVGGLMLGLSAALLVMRSVQIRLMLTLWLAVNLAVYHFGMHYYGGANLFVCLGNLNSPVTFSPTVMNVVIWIVLGWMLAGSAGFLIADWVARWKRKRSEAEPPVSGANTAPAVVAQRGYESLLEIP